MRCAVLCTMILLVTAAGVRADELRPLRDGVPVVATAAAPELDWSADPASVDGPISPAKAVLYSLLLPGLGDYQLGNRSRAVGFFIAEGAIWTAYGVMKVQGHQREDDYQQLAVQFAGVSRTGHSDDFYAKLREYASSDAYAADVKLDGRAALSDNGKYLDRIGADALDRYFVENRLADYEPWQWTSHERQLQYSEMRSSSKTSYRRANYMLAAAAANRVVSAVVAYAAARGANRSQTMGYQMNFAPSEHGLDLSLTVTRSF
ncbi:MAG TPA: hypothetical protein VFH88_08820 [Candidatus Krumholzibacteria bacterium]|nr:hypothetical protein [Candidatus Krumholzibacteria bacterium]